MDLTDHKNRQYVMDTMRDGVYVNISYNYIFGSASGVIRVNSYLVKRSEMEKLDAGQNVRQNTTGLGLGASKNCKILDRRVR